MGTLGILALVLVAIGSVLNGVAVLGVLSKLRRIDQRLNELETQQVR